MENTMKMSDLKIMRIDKNNLNIFNNLGQAYEAEFSSITNKVPDQFGVFKIDTLPNFPYVGYLLYYQEIPIGICVANPESEIKDIAEFYIIPSMRKKNFGYQFAIMIFDLYPGKWQVRQIQGADHAIHFWRSVIGRYTKNQYEEAIVDDEYWGIVTKQSFQNN